MEELTIVKRLPSWVQSVTVILLAKAVATWVLAPSLDVVPAYALFGAIYLIGAYLMWRKIAVDRQSVMAMVRVCSLSAAIAFALYAATLDALNDDNYFGWALVSGACTVVLLLVAWLEMRDEKSE